MPNNRTPLPASILYAPQPIDITLIDTLFCFVVVVGKVSIKSNQRVGLSALVMFTVPDGLLCSGALDPNCGPFVNEIKESKP